MALHWLTIVGCMLISGTPIRVALVCALLFVMNCTHAEADTVSPRLRPLTGRLVRLLTLGYQTSPTLATLVDELEHSDVIVHIEERRRPERWTIGHTRLVARIGGQRYLRISLDVRRGDEALVALLGHELHHAREIAQESWVTDQTTLAELYRQIGHESCARPGMIAVDTQAARKVGRQVLAELREHRGGGLLSE